MNKYPALYDVVLRLAFPGLKAPFHQWNLPMAVTQLSIYTFKVGLLDLTYKKMGHPGVFEFQINNKSCLRIIVSDIAWDILILKKKFTVDLKFKFR